MPTPTGASLFTDVRNLLHDNNTGFSSDDPYYQDTEITDALKMARQMLVKMLIDSPQVPYVTLANLSKAIPALDGAVVPSDFYRLICGYMNDGSYVPAKTILIGEAMKDSGAQQVYVRGGIFYGTQEHVLYWSMPSQNIANNNTSLVELPGSLYDAIKYQACMYLLMKEDANAKDRFVQLGAELKRKISSLA